MALTSSVIIRQSYVRIGAWLANSAELNALYNADTNFESVVTESFPPQAMWDALTGVEGEMATAVGMDQDNTLRSSIHDTVAAANGEVIPTVGAGGGKIVGVLGQVRNAVSPYRPLTPALHEDEIRAINQDAGEMYKTSYFSYALRPPRIYATVDNMLIDVCVFNEATRAAAIAANGNLLFQQCQAAYFYGLMTSLKNQDPAYTTLSNQYEAPYREWLQMPQASRDVTVEAAA